MCQAAVALLVVAAALTRGAALEGGAGQRREEDTFPSSVQEISDFTRAQEPWREIHTNRVLDGFSLAKVEGYNPPVKGPVLLELRQDDDGAVEDPEPPTSQTVVETACVCPDEFIQCKKLDGTSPECNQDEESLSSRTWQNEMLQLHETIRKTHATDSLVWDEGLSEKARAAIQACGDIKAEDMETMNIAASVDSVLTPDDSMYLFYKEPRERYDYLTGCARDTKSFARVLWVGSQRVGCWRERCVANVDGGDRIQGENGCMVACAYDPPMPADPTPVHTMLNVRPRAAQMGQAVSATCGHTELVWHAKMLKEHNDRRARHEDTDQLNLPDTNLIGNFQQLHDIAEALASQCDVHISGGRAMDMLGINVAAERFEGSSCMSPEFIMKRWYDYEQLEYNYEKGITCVEDLVRVGHFAQVVWKQARTVACAWNVCEALQPVKSVFNTPGSVVVCVYDESVKLHEPENVNLLLDRTEDRLVANQHECSSDIEWAAEMMYLHNKIRRAVSAKLKPVFPVLNLEQLSATRAATCNFQQITSIRSKGYGQNAYFKHFTETEECSTPNEVMQFWQNGHTAYRAAYRQGEIEWDHNEDYHAITQVVWGATKIAGCSRVVCDRLEGVEFAENDGQERRGFFDPSFKQGKTEVVICTYASRGDVPAEYTVDTGAKALLDIEELQPLVHLGHRLLASKRRKVSVENVVKAVKRTLDVIKTNFKDTFDLDEFKEACLSEDQLETKATHPRAATTYADVVFTAIVGRVTVSARPNKIIETEVTETTTKIIKLFEMIVKQRGMPPTNVLEPVQAHDVQSGDGSPPPPVPSFELMESDGNTRLEKHLNLETVGAMSSHLYAKLDGPQDTFEAMVTGISTGDLKTACFECEAQVSAVIGSTLAKPLTMSGTRSASLGEEDIKLQEAIHYSHCLGLLLEVMAPGLGPGGGSENSGPPSCNERTLAGGYFQCLAVPVETRTQCTVIKNLSRYRRRARDLKSGALTPLPLSDSASSVLDCPVAQLAMKATTPDTNTGVGDVTTLVASLSEDCESVSDCFRESSLDLPCVTLARKLMAKDPPFSDDEDPKHDDDERNLFLLETIYQGLFIETVKFIFKEAVDA